MKSDSCIYFKRECIASGVTLNSGTIANFSYKNPEIDITIQCPAEGRSIFGAFCQATTSRFPNVAVYNFFKRIQANQVPMLERQPSDDWTSSMSYDGPDGTKIEYSTHVALPENFTSFIALALGELSDKLERTIKILRWISNEDGSHNPILDSKSLWSMDQTFWHPTPVVITADISAKSALIISRSMQIEIEALVASGEDEPLHHSLFREASAQIGLNPRSALLIAIAAAEIAVKRCILTLVPDAEWLATNVPSPPLYLMITEYLPKLPAKFRSYPKSDLFVKVCF